MRKEAVMEALRETGGVDSTRESVSAWIHAGVAALGMGSGLIAKDLLAARDWAGIETKVAETVALVKEVKASRTLSQVGEK